jgi:hypothetical protein
MKFSAALFLSVLSAQTEAVVVPRIPSGLKSVAEKVKNASWKKKLAVTGAAALGAASLYGLSGLRKPASSEEGQEIPEKKTFSLKNYLPSYPSWLRKSSQANRDEVEQNAQENEGLEEQKEEKIEDPQ